jgi:hypothetical protein
MSTVKIDSSRAQSWQCYGKLLPTPKLLHLKDCENKKERKTPLFLTVLASNLGCYETFSQFLRLYS